MTETKKPLGRYPKIYAIGHDSIVGLFEEEVIVEEKIDGSQFSFMRKDDGQLFCFSKGATLNIISPDSMFLEGVDVVKVIADKLKPNWLYRGEYLKRPRHNVLVYGRIPNKHFIGFDIQTDGDTFLDYRSKTMEFERLGFETVPCLFQGKIDRVEKIRSFLSFESVLGSQLIEGVVVKNYSRRTKDGEVMLGKFVSEEFKEVHTGLRDKPPSDMPELLRSLVQEYTTAARWSKAVIHLKERGLIKNSPEDIGIIIKESQRDILKECETEIKEKMFKALIPQVLKATSQGIGSWYKDLLLKQSFEKE